MIEFIITPSLFLARTNPAYLSSHLFPPPDLSIEAFLLLLNMSMKSSSSSSLSTFSIEIELIYPIELPRALLDDLSFFLSTLRLFFEFVEESQTFFYFFFILEVLFLSSAVFLSDLSAGSTIEKERLNDSDTFDEALLVC